MDSISDGSNPAARLEPADLRGTGRCDDEHALLAEFEPFFEEQRNVRHEKVRPTLARGLEEIKTFLRDPRVEDRFEPQPGVIVGKHAPAQEVPVDPALGVERLIAEGLAHETRHLGIRLEQAVHGGIAVEQDHRGDELAQVAADGGFARRDAAGECHHVHGRRRIADPAPQRKDQWPERVTAIVVRANLFSPRL